MLPWYRAKEACNTSSPPSSEGDEKPCPVFIQYVNAPAPTNQIICQQLQRFDQLIRANRAATLELDRKTQVVTKQLTEISHMISKWKSKAKLSQTQKSHTGSLKNIDPFLKPGYEVQDSIISKIFGEHKYKYKLSLLQPFENTLYKERNFSLSLKLTNGSGETVMNSNRIPVTFDAYYNEDDPQMIKTTRLNTPIFRGNNQTEVYKGCGRLTKLQFKEVSSFYSSSGLFFVVYAKAQSFSYIENAGTYCERTVKPSLVRPLVIRNITVKAKKKWERG